MLCLLFLFLLWIPTNIFPADTTYSTNTTLTDDHRLSLASRALVTASVTIDGDGFKFKSPLTADQVIVIDPGFTATFQDLWLENLSPSHLNIGAGSSVIFGTGCLIKTLKDEALSETWKFSGTSTLQGNNSNLDLSGGGILEVQASGSLTIRNLKIIGVDSTNIRCADNTASITFDNVELVVPTRYTFDTGAFLIKNQTKVVGGGVFSYESAYASTIAANSTLHLSHNITFSYDPAARTQPTTASMQNLTFTNTTSKLILDAVTLDISNTGMQLMSGTMQVSKENLINSGAATTDYERGFLIGEGGTYSDYDMNIEVDPGARLQLNAGIINYKNIEIYNPVPPPPPPAPLRIGDAIALKHKTYNTYLAPQTGYSNPIATSQEYLVGSAGPVVSYYHWSVRPGNTATYWGSPSEVGDAVLSGDAIILTHHYLYYTNNRDGVITMWDPGNTAAFTSSPNPPYSRAEWLNFNHSGGMPYRIYKKGGSVGDAINQGDEVYIHRFRSGSDHAYLGSSDLAHGTEKEIYFYQVSNTSPPPNFATDFVWILDEVYPDAHLTAPNYLSWSADNLGTSGWPAAADTQF